MNTPDPHAPPEPDVAREQERPALARIAGDAHEHSRRHGRPAGLATALAACARWAERSQPPEADGTAEDGAMEGGPAAARLRYYARLYLYAQEIAEIAHRALVAELAHPAFGAPEPSALWEEEEALKALLDAHRGDAPRREPRV